MSVKLKTIKVTEKAVDNFNAIAFVLRKKQYEASEHASKVMMDLLKKHPDMSIIKKRNKTKKQ